MNQHRNQNRDDRDDHGHTNDNEHGNKAVTPAPKRGALASTSLTELMATLNNVTMMFGSGRSGLPMLLFKSREDSSPWGIGQKRTIPEDGGLWAVNLTTFMWGYICFGNDQVWEHLVPISQPMPDVAALPVHDDFPWQEELTVNMKCINGTDAGVEVVHKASTDGGLKAIKELIEAIRNRLNGGQHDGKVVPIVVLERDSYQHAKYGPVLRIVDWMPFDGPAPEPAPAPEPPPTEQPRRRRVA